MVSDIGVCLAGKVMSPKRNSVEPSPLGLVRVTISAEGKRVQRMTTAESVETRMSASKRRVARVKAPPGPLLSCF